MLLYKEDFEINNFTTFVYDKNLNSIGYKLELEKEASTTLYAYYSVSELRIIYLEMQGKVAHSTYFKLDNDYNIVSELSFKDGTQILLDRYSYGISKTNNNNEIEKTITLTPSNGYSARNKYVAISNDKLYIALVSNKYDSTNKIYNHQIEYFEYDKNLELKNTYVITETSTSYQLSGGQIYVNNNGVFTSYNNKYYKINSDFSFTESTSENMYSNFRGEGYDEPKASEDVEMLEAISWFTYNFVDDLEEQAEEDNYQENTNTYAYGTYSFDYYYDKEINEILLSITVIMEIDSNNYEKITETSYLLTLDSNNLEEKDLIVYHVVFGYSYKEIAEFLNENPKTIGKKCRRLLNILKNIVKED